jgi:hypothetical protein
VRDHHLSKPRFDPLDDVSNDMQTDVGNLVIIDVPGDRALFAFDHAIRDARVIRVQNETHFLQRPGEKLATNPIGRIFPQTGPLLRNW